MIIRLLKSGYLIIDIDNQVIRIIPYNHNSNNIEIQYSNLDDASWGFIYEKHVGQHFEQRGYSVEYNGLNKGFLDGGIDLIAQKEDRKYYIQCKYTKLSKSAIENILFKAGNTIFKMSYTKNDVFALVIPSKEFAFRRIRIESNSIIPRYQYPLYDYFLSKNNTQNFIRLEIIEIPMDIWIY